MTKKPTIASRLAKLATKPAEHRLTKVKVKQKLVAKAQRAQFLAEVKATKPTEASRVTASQLVKRVKAAKAASFLDQYRAAD